jgi:hypothetical protein
MAAVAVRAPDGVALFVTEACIIGRNGTNSYESSTSAALVMMMVRVNQLPCKKPLRSGILSQVYCSATPMPLQLVPWRLQCHLKSCTGSSMAEVYSVDIALCSYD